MSNVIKEKIRVTAASGQSARETVGQTRGEEFSFLPPVDPTRQRSIIGCAKECICLI